MGMLDRLKALFLTANLPEDTREVFEKASTSRDLLAGLEELLGRNEMDLREKEEHQAALEKALRLEEERIRKGDLSQAQQTNTLRRIERLEKQKSGLDNLISIYNENVNLHLNLITKIQEMEAMRARGIKEEQVDMVMEEMTTNLGEYRRVRLAAGDGERGPQVTSGAEEQERLEAIRKRIVGSRPREGSSSVQRAAEKMEAE